MVLLLVDVPLTGSERLKFLSVTFESQENSVLSLVPFPSFTGHELRRSLCHHLTFVFDFSPLQEITLWRKGDVVRKSMSHQAAIASQRFEGSAASESALEQAAKEESG